MIISTYNEIKNFFNEEKNEISGEIKFVTSAGLASEWLSDILAEFSLLYRNIKVNITGTDQAVGIVERGFDVAFLPWQSSFQNLIQKSVFNFEMGLFASPTYLKEMGDPQKIQDLDHHRLIALTEWGRHTFGNMNYHLFIDSHERKKRDSFFSTTSGVGVAKACHHGVGIAFLPKKAPYLDGLNLCPVLRNYKFPSTQGHLIYPESHQNLKKVIVFCQFLEKKIKENFEMKENFSNNALPRLKAVL